MDGLPSSPAYSLEPLTLSGTEEEDTLNTLFIYIHLNERPKALTIYNLQLGESVCISFGLWIFLSKTGITPP